MPSINIGELAATTIENYEKSLQDNIFKKHVLLNHMKNNGGVKEYDGGTKIRVPLMYATSSAVMAFSGTDLLDNTYQDTVDAAEYEWRYYNSSIVFTLEDELKNSGASQVLDLLEAKIKQAEMSLSERLNSDLYDGTSASKEITGIETLIAASGTVGAINGTTNSFWQSFVDSTSEALSIADMRTAKNSANLGNGGSSVSIIVTTQTLHEKYASLLTASFVMNQPVGSKETKRLGDGGFSALEFEGVPVVFDEQCTSGAMYFINTDNLKLGIHKDANFKVKKKAEPSNQHVYISDVVFSGNTVMNRRKSLAKLTAKTA